MDAIDLFLLFEAENRAFQRERVFRDRTNPFDLSPELFIQSYRVNKHLMFTIIETLKPDLQKRRQITTTLSVEEQVLNALHFYATGSFQHCVGNIIFNGLSQSSVSRSIECVTNAIISRLSHHVSFPLDRQSQLDIKKTFWNICRLPNIVGAIDCTHITIRKPVKESHVYINRKGHYSINVQLVCNTDLKILNVCAKWPGSTHDSFIWRNSSLHELFSTGHIPSSYLLGDSGYPLEPWLMTPLIETHTQAEEEYNQRHIRGRVCIERCNGVLKSRWRCLHSSGGSLQYAPGKVCRIIVACVILHNLCITENMPSIIDDNLIFDNMDQDDLLQELTRTRGANILREELINLCN